MDANTTRGIEFSLTGTKKKGKANYSISTSHKLLSTNFDKINIKPLNLIFHIHNHDGPLDNSNVISPPEPDLIKSTTTLNSVARSTSMLPRFFISLENGGMKEFYHIDKLSENTKMNIKTVDLKNIKKYDYYKKRP